MQHVTAYDPGDRAFKTVGSCARQELLAWELARALDDHGGIRLYRSYCRKYPEELLRKALSEIQEVPANKIKKGHAALFNYLVQQYAQGTTENPGN